MALIMNEVMTIINRYVPSGFVPKIGLILGSGFAALADEITNTVAIPYQAIPGLQAGAVSGHASLLVLGYLNGVPVACLRGRLHLYEGASYAAIQILVRLIKWLGAEVILLTGAAGSLRADVGPGELMLITDHINFHPGNPLVGINDESIGPRFFSMVDAYDVNLRKRMLEQAVQRNIALAEGVYISTLGPSFETAAEIKAFQQWGAHAVGMSVVPEVIIARHAGLRVIAVTAITNAAAGLSMEKITHGGSLSYGAIGAHKLNKLIPGWLDVVQNDLAVTE